MGEVIKHLGEALCASGCREFNLKFTLRVFSFSLLSLRHRRCAAVAAPPSLPITLRLSESTCGSLKVGNAATAFLSSRWLSEYWRIFAVNAVITKFPPLITVSAVDDRLPVPPWRRADLQSSTYCPTQAGR